MLDVFRVADLLAAHAVRTHGTAVSLIACYGSHATGEATPCSDLDIFYTPIDGANPPLSRQFLIEGIPVDFWPIPWNALEQFAEGTLRGWAVAPSLVSHAKLLYARSEEDRTRFQSLRQRISDLQQPAAQKQMVRRALEAFKDVLVHLGNLHLARTDGDPASIRLAGWNVVTAAVECLALVNQTTFPKGWSHLLEQLPLLDLRPDNSEELVTVIATASDPAQITAAAEEFAASTRRILRQQQEAFPPEVTVAGTFGSAYPEIREHITKLLSLCEQQRPVASSFEAAFIQNEISQMLADTESGLGAVTVNLYAEYATPYRDLGFPEMVGGASPPDLNALAAQARNLDACIRHWLQANALSLHTFKSLEEFEHSLYE